MLDLPSVSVLAHARFPAVAAPTVRPEGAGRPEPNVALIRGNDRLALPTPRVRERVLPRHRRPGRGCGRPRRWTGGELLPGRRRTLPTRGADQVAHGPRGFSAE